MTQNGLDFHHPPLSIVNLSKNYIDKRTGNIIPVLKNINLELKENGIIGLLGKNGAGKTTFIKCCVNLLSYSGNINYFDKELQTLNRHNNGDMIYSALFEGNRNIYWKLTPIENIKFFSGLRGIKYKEIKSVSDYLFDALGLTEKANTLVENLSRGMQQKVSLVLALSLNSPIVFLDEPTLGLDIESKNNLIDFFLNGSFKRNRLIVISSHDLNFITSICSDIYLLRSGSISRKSNLDTGYRFSIRMNKNVEFLKNNTTSIKSLKQKKIDNNNFIYYITDYDELMMTLHFLEKDKESILAIHNLEYDLETFYLTDQ